MSSKGREIKFPNVSGHPSSTKIRVVFSLKDHCLLIKSELGPTERNQLELNERSCLSNNFLQGKPKVSASINSIQLKEFTNSWVLNTRGGSLINFQIFVPPPRTLLRPPRLLILAKVSKLHFHFYAKRTEDSIHHVFYLLGVF